MQTLASRRKWFSLAAVNMGNFVPPLDTGIMAFILPTISLSLRAPITVVIWIPLTSLLVEAAFMPIFGRFSDAHGRKRYFVLGCVLFAIGSFLAGNSLTIFELLIYRIIQSLGGAFILSNGRALIVDAFPPGERGFALGTHISVIYVGMTVGTAVAGSIVTVTQAVGWRYVFYVSGAIAALTIPLSLLALRESPKNPKVRSDFLGSLFFIGGLGAALIALTTNASGQSTVDIYLEYIRIPIIDLYVYLNSLVSIPLSLIGAVCAVSTVLFVVREWTAKQPLFDFHLFRTNPMFASTNFSALFLYVSNYFTLFTLSFYLQEIKQVDALTASLILAVEPISVTFFSVIGGWIADRTGSRDPAVAGIGIVAVALLLFSTISESTSTFLVGFLLAMLGAGIGIFAPNNTNANLASVPPGDRALANGILGMMRFTGQSISLAFSTIIIGIVALGGLSVNGGNFSPAQYTAALSLNFILGCVVAVLAAVIAYKGREPKQTPATPGLEASAAAKARG